MCIFAGHHRTVIIRAFRYFQQAFPTCVLRPFLVLPFGNAGIQVLLFHTGIKTADYIHCFRVGFSVYSLSSFIVYGTCRIKIMQPSRNSSKIRSVTTFISHAPHHYRRMILSRSAIRTARSRKAACQSDVLANVPRNPCSSISASSITYSPKLSHSSYQRLTLG